MYSEVSSFSPCPVPCASPSVLLSLLLQSLQAEDPAPQHREERHFGFRSRTDLLKYGSGSGSRNYVEPVKILCKR